MTKYSFKPRFWPTVFTGVMLVCLLALGFWQMHRLEWKLGLIAQIEERAFMEPISLPTDNRDPDLLEYQSVVVNGTFLNDKEMTRYSVGPNGEPGYDLYTPFVSGDGYTIIINRGWVPEALKSQDERRQTLETDKVTVKGLLRKPESKLWYGPENEPTNNNWYYNDLTAMAAAQNISNVYPMYLFAAKEGGDLNLPIAGRTEINIVNNHLDYVLTWFGLAIVLVVIYVIAHLKKNEETV